MQLALLLLQEQPDMAQIQKAMIAMFAIMPIIILIGMAIIIVPCWFICKKAGFSPWLSLLVIVPFGGLVLLYVLAFAEWKVTAAMPPQLNYPYPPPPPRA